MPERRTPLYDFHYRSARNLIKGAPARQEATNFSMNPGEQAVFSLNCAKYVKSLYFNHSMSS